MSVHLNGSNFGYFSFNPSSPLLSAKDQNTALALSIIMGIFTVGVGHLISSIVYSILKQQMSELLAKIDDTYRKSLSDKSKENNNTPDGNNLVDLQENCLANYAPSFRLNFNGESLVAETLSGNQPRPEKININDLQDDRLLAQDQIAQRFQQHQSTLQSKIKKTANIQFSTVLANTPQGTQTLFALYKGKKIAGCGNGNFGAVKLAQNLITGEWCAVKVTREKINATDAYKELRLKTPEQELQGLQVAEMLKGSAYRIDQENHIFYLFMEHLSGDSLNKLDPKNLDYKKYVEIAIGALHSLKDFHEKGFLHRDVKSQNMMHNPKSLLPIAERTKLIDFGSALPVDSNGEVVAENSFGMTEALTSWKQSDQKFHLSQYTDMFSMGNILRDLFNIIRDYEREIKMILLAIDKHLHDADTKANIVESLELQKIKLQEKLNNINSSDIWLDIYNVVKRMSPSWPNGDISKLTATEALSEFQAIYQKHWPVETE